MVSQLLPPNSTPLERALASVLPRQSLDALADAPAWHEGNAPESYLPWLAAEYGLADFVGYFPGVRELLAAGKPWLRLRGTAAAVKLALSWIGMQGRVEQDGSLLQIDPGSPEAPANLPAIRHLVGASVPAHVELYRLYHGYDRRVLHASQGGRWDDHFLSDDSGVWIDGIKLSFGRRFAATAARPETPATLRLHRQHSARVLYPDVLRWGVMHWGDAPVYNHPIQRGRLIGQGNTLGLIGEALLAGRRTRAKAAFALSEGDRLGEPNTRFGGYAQTQHNTMRWSDPDTPLSGFDPGGQRTPIDEVWIVTHGQSAEAPADLGLPRRPGVLRRLRVLLAIREASDAHLSRARLHSSTADLGPRAGRYGWSGAWDSRRWSGDVAFTHQTLTE